MDVPASEIEALLAEERWIQRLARGLVRDRNTADDLVQEAYATVLSSDAARPRSARGWLAGVVRNLRRDLARSGTRRERRERAAAKPEATATTDELVAEVELRKRVAEAVLALDEPLRRTIVLRFFKDQSLPAIARSEKIAVSTAHERVERGLAQLRSTLDRAHGDRRETWAVGLLAFAHPQGCWPAKEVLVMGTGAKVAAAVLVLGTALAWWTTEFHEDRAPSGESVSTRALEPEPRVAAVPALVETSPAREAVAPGPVKESPAPARLEPSVRGHVIDQHGAPVPFLEVGYDSNHALRATSAADGSFALVPPSDGSRAIVSLDERFATLVRHGWRDELRVVVVGPSVRFAGVVLDPEHEPVANATLTFQLRDRLFREVGLQRPTLDEDAWTVASDEAGHFELASVAGGEGVYLEVAARGFEKQELALPAAGDTDLVVVVKPDARMTTIRGRVLLADGRPASSARVSAGEEIVVADGEGSFALLWRGTTGRTVKDANGVWRQEGIESAVLTAVLPHRLPARVRLTELDLALPVELRLGGEPLSIRGRVVDAAGQPREGSFVRIVDPTHFGKGDEVWTGDEGSALRIDRSTVEQELCAGGERSARTAQDGSFELGCLVERAYRIELFDPRSCSRVGPWSLQAGSAGVELVFTPEPSVRRVAGRLVDLEGNPLAGAEITPLRDYSGSDSPSDAELPTVETDADGRFVFDELATDGTTLQIMHERTFFRFVALADHADVGHLELVEPLLCELQLDWSARPDAVDRLQVFDGSGKELEIMEQQGVAFSWGDGGVEVRDGLSNVLRVPQSAASVGLLREGIVVLTLPVRPDPRERTTLRP